nr:ribonuclease P protein component [bacterium]
MQKRYRLRKNREFQWVYRRGKSYPSRTMVLICVRARSGVRIGFAVGKKVGGSVKRNRVKRLLKENARPLMGQVAPGWRIVIVAREAAVGEDFASLGRTLGMLMKKSGVMKTQAVEG